MQWQDEAILLHNKRLGERHARLGFFTREHGLHYGIVQHALSKEKRAVLIAGNIFNVSWHARLAEHLGLFRPELTESITALLLANPQKLAALNSILTLLATSLSEHEPQPDLYETTLHMLQHLVTSEEWRHAYIDFEIALLATLGFGLDLSCCVVTGSTHDLQYVSPKSGKAVSAEAGAPYQEKLLPLPVFLRPGQSDATAEPEEIQQALAITSHFLTRYYLEERRSPPPYARDHLVERVAAHTAHHYS